MNTYTLTAGYTHEAVKAGLEKIAARTRAAAPAVKYALMFVGAPLIGLAFVIALPVIAAALCAYYVGKLIAARWTRIARRVRNVALFLAAPFIGLAYMVALPFVGLGTLVYVGVKAARR